MLNLVATYPIIVLAVLVCAYRGWKWYRRSRQPLVLNDTLTDVEVLADFQRRRRIFLVAITIFGLMIVYLYWVISRVREARESFLGLPINVHAGLVFALLIGSILTASLVYRCPRCGQAPWASVGSGVDLNPATCPTCGCKLQ